MFMIRRETGGPEPAFGGFVDGSETFAGRWVPGLLALYTELNCERGMTRALNQLLNRNLGDHTDEAQWPMELVFMVEAALELGNREAVHALRPFVAQLCRQEPGGRSVRRAVRQRRPISRPDRRARR